MDVGVQGAACDKLIDDWGKLTRDQAITPPSTEKRTAYCRGGVPSPLNELIDPDNSSTTAQLTRWWYRGVKPYSWNAKTAIDRILGIVPQVMNLPMHPSSFVFLREDVKTPKASVTGLVPAGKFVGTQDVLSAWYWLLLMHLQQKPTGFMQY